MTFVSIINSLFILFQNCSGCPSSGTQADASPTCFPCCPAIQGTGCGGPPPPPGTPIDTYLYVLFFIALVFGIYINNKKRTKA